MHTKYALHPTCMLTCMCIYDYNADELASLSLFKEINGFSDFIYRFLSLFFIFYRETGQLREVEWDQDMNQAQLEPGILCHDHILHKPSIFQYKPPFFRHQPTVQFIKTKDKMLFAQFNIICLYVSTPKIQTHLFKSAFTFHILNRHSALHLKRITSCIFCLPDAWPREICRGAVVCVFTCACI